MAELVTLEEHTDTELTTVAIQVTTEWEAVVGLVYLQECGLGVPLHVDVCCYCMYVHHIVGKQLGSTQEVQKLLHKVNHLYIYI